MKILSRLLICVILVAFVAVNVTIVWFWLPYKREFAASNTLKRHGVSLQARPLFRPLPCNLIRKVVPNKYDNVCERVEVIALPGEFTDECRTALATHLGSFKHLRTLDCSNSEIQDGLLRTLSDALPWLTRLKLANTPISDDDMADLGFRRLTHLSLRDTRISDRALVHVSELKTLRYLDLSRTTVTFRGLAHLESLPHLERLDLRGISPGTEWAPSPEGIPPLRELYLADVRLTDESLGQFADWARSLEYLDLSNTQITDRGIDSLSRLPRLHSVDLSGTRVTRASTERLGSLSNLKLLVCSREIVSQELAAQLATTRPDMIVFGL